MSSGSSHRSSSSVTTPTVQLRRPLASMPSLVDAHAVARKRSSWGPTEVMGGASGVTGMGTGSGKLVGRKGHRRTPSDGRLPMPSLDNAVRVLQHHKTPAEKGKFNVLTLTLSLHFISRTTEPPHFFFQPKK